MVLQDEPIPVYGDGITPRDYTYVGDIVRGIRATMDYDSEFYATMNMGSGQPVDHNDMIGALEDVLGRNLERNHLPEQPGDVPQTWANISRTKNLIGYVLRVDFQSGVRRFVDHRTSAEETTLAQ